MSDKPSYLGLINAIAVGESRAHAYLTAWAQVTPDADVRAVLCTVAAREGEHGMSFAKRVNELGFVCGEGARPPTAGVALDLGGGSAFVRPGAPRPSPASR